MSKQKNQGNAKFGSIRHSILTAFIVLAILNVAFSILSAVINNMSVSVFFIILATVILLGYGFFLSIQIASPLEKIHKTLHELSLGHLDARSGYRKNNDIGILSGDVDALAAFFKNDVIGVISKISAGDISMNVEIRDKQDLVTPEIKKITACMRSLSHDTERLINAVASGNLNERAYTETYKGSWKYLIDGMNTLVDKISTPLNEVMDVTRSLAVNDYTHLIQNQYEGTFNELANDINAVRNNLLNMQGAFVRVAKGDTAKLEEFQKAGKKSENDYMIPSIIKLMETIRGLISEIGMITSEASKGHIKNIRGDSSKFEGGYREIIDGVNNTLDTIYKPIHETTRVLDALAVNDFTVAPDKSTMIGDFEHLGQSIGKVEECLNILQKITISISIGDFSGLPKLEAIGQLSESDHLLPAYIKMMQTVNKLMAETNALANAAAEGRLDYRSDTAGFEGEFANILKAFNTAFHNLAKPVKEISGVMEQIADGTLGTSVEGEYQGVFGQLAEEVNKTSATLKSIIGKISFVLTNIADGNLNLEEVDAYQGDFADISTGLNTIILSLNEFIGNISNATEQVAAGAKQVSAGSQNLSQGATEQASSVEQLTSSISVISEQTKNNAQNANEANSLAASTKESAQKGNSQMKEMLASMNGINESSANISKIIKVIDDIAFQTNILALNAAVEAARAGQYGKGFAVVADEVRNLAAKSANAAKDTTTLIEGSIEKIGSGTKIANETASALSSIMGSIDKVSDLVSDIAASSNEQATGIAQIDKGVEVVSNVVQTNSATAEQSAAASEELSSQSEYLREMLARFQLRPQE